MTVNVLHIGEAKPFSLSHILTEAKTSARDLINMFKDRSEWGDQIDHSRVVGGNLEVVDTFFFGC